MGFSVKPDFVIDSRESLAYAARTFGILPFFPNNIPGLSVEEMCAPGLLFGGNYEEGCWEWKGPVVRKRESAYGKFFRKKAGFVSLELLPDFLNYRRSVYPLKDGDYTELLLDIIRENDSLSSTELKRLIFGNKKKRDRFDIPEYNEFPTLSGKGKSLESPLQRLQMGGWIIISDFEYNMTKRGERYGWGVARYSTPEYIFKDIIDWDIKRNPTESLYHIISYVQKFWKSASKKDLEKLLK